jgi:hypothetical protein
MQGMQTVQLKLTIFLLQNSEVLILKQKYTKLSRKEGGYLPLKHAINRTTVAILQHAFLIKKSPLYCYSGLFIRTSSWLMPASD